MLTVICRQNILSYSVVSCFHFHLGISQTQVGSLRRQVKINLVRDQWFKAGTESTERQG
jgi:hypothetical protein